MRTEELHQLYAACYRRLVVQLYALTDDLADAQDCVQDAFVRALARPALLDDAADPEAELRTLAAGRARSRRRRRALHDRLPRRAAATRPSVVPPGLGPENVALVRALNGLPSPQRQAVALHHLGDLSVAEIAQLTHAPAGTVAAQLTSGRSRLAELLADDPPPTTAGTGEEGDRA